MYFIKTEFAFDSAHFLYGYEGKCSNIHGHRWRVEVTVKNAFLQRNGQQKGMIMDFADLKRALGVIADHYDHSLIYEKNTLKADTMECLKRDGFRLVEVPFRPTAENLARHFFMIIRERGYRPHNVTVYETPNNCAMYEEG
ncbi:MAG: 6-carboxytetrahydropterin synthase QueD [Oscillospiraceae bacterium]|nr:6-carboxytetrahydropterin synthase QueD [Oscillospiraceae bacterium]